MIENMKSGRLQGDRLLKLRNKYGYSRERLAEALQISVMPLYNYENEKSDPSSAVVAKIARLFNVSADYLLGITDDPRTYQNADLTPDEQELLEAYRNRDVAEIVQLAAKVSK